MDHRQFSAIRGLPFLLSSHVLTNFVLIGLKRSVRAHGDPNFQRIQDITRNSPYFLQGNTAIELEFKRLMKENITFVGDWTDDLIDSSVQRMYSKCKPAQEASNEYVDACRKQFMRDGINFVVANSEDCHVNSASRADPVRTNNRQLINKLNTKLREPPRLIFFCGALFEVTVNVKGERGYSQSQLLIMLDVPSQIIVESWGPITLLAAPSGITHLDTSDGTPSKEELIEAGWKVVKINCAPDRSSRKVTSGCLIESRKQYSLKHVGAGTINKQTGNTITGKVAIEISRNCQPWDKAQVVVMLSRTCRACDTIIVGDIIYAINRIWEVITIGNQWTNYIDRLLDRLSINGSDQARINATVNYADNYPYRTCDIFIPTDCTGYIYILVSVRDVGRTYIGECLNLSRRFNQHNSVGGGSHGTADSMYQPYFLAGCICGMGHLSQLQRESLEGKWKRYVTSVINQGNHDLSSRVRKGEEVVEEYNENRIEEERITFVITMRSCNPPE